MLTVRKRITGPGIFAPIFNDAPSCGWMRITSTLGVSSWTAVLANGRCGGVLKWTAVFVWGRGDLLPVGREKGRSAQPQVLLVMRGEKKGLNIGERARWRGSRWRGARCRAR